MKVFRASFQSFIIVAAINALLSGCATHPKPAPNIAPTLPLSPPVQPEIKPAETPPKTTENSSPVVPAPTRAPLNATSPEMPVVAPPLATVTVRRATITGSQESSMLLDNFTAFVATVDGKKIEAGRKGWNVPLEIEAGRRILGVEFNRGVFLARGRLEIEAVPNAHYQLKYATDAELFGNNSYCNFWVIDAQTGQTVSMLSKASVEKVADGSKPSLP